MEGSQLWGLPTVPETQLLCGQLPRLLLDTGALRPTHELAEACGPVAPKVISVS